MCFPHAVADKMRNIFKENTVVFVNSSYFDFFAMGVRRKSSQKFLCQDMRGDVELLETCHGENQWDVDVYKKGEESTTEVRTYRLL